MVKFSFVKKFNPENKNRFLNIHRKHISSERPYEDELISIMFEKLANLIKKVGVMQASKIHDKNCQIIYFNSVNNSDNEASHK